MKLLTYTSRTQLLLFLVLFGFFSIFFYLVLSWNVLQNVDEVLSNRKINLLAYLNDNPEAPFKEDNFLDDFTFYPIDQATFQKGIESYTDTLIYEFVDDELDEYRKLSTTAELHGNYYKLAIVKPHLEAPEMILTTAITLGGLFLGLVLSYFLSQRIISRKIWRPFYEMLEMLRNYRMDKQQEPVLSSSRIDEFQLLNKAITELTQKNKEVFESQKQFIENASHEMNTPLTIVQSRLETLIGHTNLTGEQASIVEGIIRSTQRLKKLNRTLLLLSKIENRQFLLSEEVNLNKIIDKSLEYYEEQKAALNIKVAIEYQDSLIVRGNIMLTEILIQNLLKNAFLHNIQDGTITISANHHMLTISNTGPNSMNSGKGPALVEKKLFRRFFKKSENPDTWGLGLAIAHKIAETSGWGLEYRQEEVLHVFKVFFK